MFKVPLKLFHRRVQEKNKEIPSTFLYELPVKVRRQILLIWEMKKYQEIESVLSIIRMELGTQELYSSHEHKWAYNDMREYVQELCSFFVDPSTDDNVALSIVELIIGLNWQLKELCNMINYRLQYERIGYKFVVFDNGEGRLVRIEDEVFYDECTIQTLGILNEYPNARQHLLTAYDELKSCAYDDALNDLRRSVESLLKTRFNTVGIQYDTDRDGLGNLLDIVQRHVVCGEYKFHFFKELILQVGRVSNPQSHGQAEGQSVKVDAVFVRFLINQAAANLLFLAEVELNP